MKKITYLIAALILMTSCEDFLDTKNLTKQDTSNWPMTVSDAEQALTGIYSALSMSSSAPIATAFYAAEIAGDDRFGGGGENDKSTQAIDRLMGIGTNTFGTLWTVRYRGIFRANMALESLDNCTGWKSEEQKNQLKGEIYFLRALYYFELSQVFGEVPLVLKTVAENIPQTPADQTYAQIASDLKMAIELMQPAPYAGATEKSGHATRWAAQALMARVYLFYTGYYGKNSLPLAAGTDITKEQVTTWLEDCMTNSGHGLVSDFRNLWPESNEYTAKNYAYPGKKEGETILWAGDGNKETVFAIKFGIGGNWTRTGFANQFIVYFGLRSGNGEKNTFPFGKGWGFGTVNSSLWNEWMEAEPNDVRRTASILDVKQLPNYTWGADKMMEETGYWQKKYIPITAQTTTGALMPSYASLKDGSSPSEFQLCHTQDLVLIRYADVLLMHSELKQDAAGLNQVRTRAKLAPVSFSMEALKRERRYELAFEGLRYFDLMRWGDAPEALAKQANVSIKNRNAAAVMGEFGSGYKARYAVTKGFWPIPETQISLSGDVLKQNPGWGTPEAEFPGW